MPDPTQPYTASSSETLRTGPWPLAPAGLPVPNSTQPFWLSERSALDHHRTTKELPTKADVVIVGSGLSGAILAYSLLKQRPKLNIVMLEAREVCSGATARNGGQVKTDPYTTYIARKAKYGAKVANELIKFETDHLYLYQKLLQEEPISCAFHPTTAFDVCMTDAIADISRASYHERLTDWPEDTKRFREIDDREELQRLSQVKGGLWGCMYAVASIWPYKLATGLLSRCFELAKAGGGSFNLQTMTPVTALESGQGHRVLTDRGSVKADKVILCTNGYMSNLLPEMADRIVPIRGTAASLLPPRPQLPNTPSSEVFRPLFTSFMIKYGGGRGEYFISRQEGRKEMVLGGAKEGFLSRPELWYGVTDDSVQMPGAYEHFKAYMPKHFVNYPDPTSHVDRVWTGILGYSVDKFPWVGPVPFKPHGLYIMAGFHGHGMSRIPGSAYALSRLILSDAKQGDGLKVLRKAGLPNPYLFTMERYESKVNEIFQSMGFQQPR